MKIDVSKIPGYAEMSAEEKLKALEEFEIEVPKDNSAEITNLKDALSKANSQAAEWKRQFREKQTEQERTEAERAEREKAVEEELRTLRRDKTVSGYIAEYLNLGYSNELARKAAEATADGNAAGIFECQQEFWSVKKKELEAAALGKQPSLSVGGTPSSASANPEDDARLRSYFGLKPKK